MNWLLLRGLVRERRHWGDFPARLAERTGGEVLALDLPGVGTERGRRPPTSVAGIVADLRPRFAAARSPGPWSIFAPSLGGMVALAWAARHPEDFARVAVCNTSARDLAAPLRRFSLAAIATVARGLLARDPEPHVLALVSNTPHGRACAARFATFGRVGVGVLARQLLAGARATTPASLTAPLLVLCSDGDRLCDPRASRTLAARLGGALAVHPTAGHDLPLDDPEWVIARLTM
ncbi:MAG: alpha/beta fold hydrolase [Myxococcota bacterium]